MGAAQRIAIVSGFVGAHHLTVVDCAKCGEVFGLLSSTNALRQRDGASLFCPNGHSNVYQPGKSLEQRIADQANARAARAEAEATHQREMREWAESNAKGANIRAGMAKAALKRTIDRVHAGVCPHCHRTFKQLAAHMRTKHSR